MKRIDTADGSTQTIAEAPGTPRGGDVGQRDVIVFGSGTPPRLARVSARGGRGHRCSRAVRRTGPFLPDGRHFLYTGEDRFAEREHHGRSIDGSESEAGFKPRSLVASR